MELRLESNRIVLFDENQEIGEITWIDEGDALKVDHTFVNPQFRGQNLARKLVDAVVEMARAKNLKIIPVCPYVKRVFELESKYQDIW